jgi:hypothetical protein
MYSIDVYNAYIRLLEVSRLDTISAHFNYKAISNIRTSKPFNGQYL